MIVVANVKRSIENVLYRKRQRTEVGQYMQYGNGGGGFVYSYTVRRFAVVSGRPQFLLERLLNMA